MNKKETIVVDKATLSHLFNNLCCFHAYYIEDMKDEDSKMMAKDFKKIMRDIKKIMKNK